MRWQKPAIGGSFWRGMLFVVSIEVAVTATALLIIWSLKELW